VLAAVQAGDQQHVVDAEDFRDPWGHREPAADLPDRRGVRPRRGLPGVPGEPHALGTPRPASAQVVGTGHTQDAGGFTSAAISSSPACSPGSCSPSGRGSSS
jgi:hypothetical protein